MYMDILEQEVEALGAELTRLRLMVHRVTQVMEAPVPGRHSYADPLSAAVGELPAWHSASGVAAPVNLQDTVDSYKQILPLVQLLLDQQQQQKRQPHKQSSSRERKRRSKSSRHRRRHHRSKQPTPPSSSSSSTSSSSTRSSSSSADDDRSDASQHSAASSPRDVATSQTKASEAPKAAKTSTKAAPPASVTKHAASATDEPQMNTTTAAPVLHHTSSTGRRRHSTVSIEETPSQVEQPAPQPASTPHSLSVLDRLRAQREEAAGKADSSTDSSNEMPMAKSQTRSAATSPSASDQRHQYKFPASMELKSATRLEAAEESPHHSRQNLSVASSKLHYAPSAQDAASSTHRHRKSRDADRSTSLPPEDMGYYPFSALQSMSESPQQTVHSPLLSRSNSEAPAAAAALRPPSAGQGRSATAGSLEHSEQGMYNYSALASFANSPSVSHVHDDVGRGARTATSTAQSRALDVSNSMQSQPRQQHHRQPSKQLPQQTSAISKVQPAYSSSSSSSDSSDDSNRQASPIVLSSVAATRPFGGGVVLGARQPISVHSPSSNSQQSAGFPSAGRPAVQTAPAGTAAKPTEARVNLFSNLLPLQSSSSTSSSTSSSDSSSSSPGGGAAAFQRPQSRPVAQDDHQESSFHHYSDATSSRPTSHLPAPSQYQQQSSPHQREYSPSQSPDAYSFAVYSLHHSAQNSPQPQDIDADASPDMPGALSPSMRPAAGPAAARNDSLDASSASRRGSLASGGYYYGYDLNATTASQQSMMSGPVADRNTAVSSPGYDY